MWMLIFIYGLCTLFIAWFMFGYFALTWFIGRFKRRKTLAPPASFPSVSLIIPCYNEEAEISNKISNIKSLDYPSDKMEVIFADGGSKDSTLAVIEREKLPSWKAMRCAIGGKVNQMNEAIKASSGEIVVNTDCDAILEPDCLKWIAAEFDADPSVMVVGAFCEPTNALSVEKHYWMSQNKARLMESDCETSSIVVAPCYAFKRGLVEFIPPDVVADDIYVAMSANAAGFRTVYSRKARGVETRNPGSYAEFLPHKFRKSNAYLRETLRFLYRLPEMSLFCKTMVLVRLSQQLLLPWSCFVWGLLTISLVSLWRLDMVFLSCALLLFSALLAHFSFAWIEMPRSEMKKSFAQGMICNAITLIILMSTGVSYPFFRQSSSYSRIGGGKTAEKPASGAASPQ